MPREACPFTSVRVGEAEYAVKNNAVWYKGKDNRNHPLKWRVGEELKDFTARLLAKLTAETSRLDEGVDAGKLSKMTLVHRAHYWLAALVYTRS